MIFSSYKFLTEIPAVEGPVRLCVFRGMVVVVSQFGPARLVVQREDGSYEVKVIQLKK